jgi:hypothetical protein
MIVLIPVGTGNSNSILMQVLNENYTLIRMNKACCIVHAEWRFEISLSESDSLLT